MSVRDKMQLPLGHSGFLNLLETVKSSHDNAFEGKYSTECVCVYVCVQIPTVQHHSRVSLFLHQRVLQGLGVQKGGKMAVKKPIITIRGLSSCCNIAANLPSGTPEAA